MSKICADKDCTKEVPKGRTYCSRKCSLESYKRIIHRHMLSNKDREEMIKKQNAEIIKACLGGASQVELMHHFGIGYDKLMLILSKESTRASYLLNKMKMERKK